MASIFWHLVGIHVVILVLWAILMPRLVTGILVFVVVTVFAHQAFAQIPDAAPHYRRDLTRNAHLIWGLDAPVATFAAQIHQESGWRRDARSPYAFGLAQFTPDTAAWIGGLDAGLASNEPGNPVWALRALVRYDAWLYARVPGAASLCARMALALRGYNGGLGYVQKEARSGQPCEVFRSVANCRENLDYPRRILTRLEPLYVRAGWGIGGCS